ncbi:hypothetical protein A2U01_0093753, partial [Trifolium medium]|nr:hypothetical protein [Trifolium medium]
SFTNNGRTLDAGRKLRKLKGWKVEKLEKDSKNLSFPLFIEDHQRTHLHGPKRSLSPSESSLQSKGPD